MIDDVSLATTEASDGRHGVFQTRGDQVYFGNLWWWLLLLVWLLVVVVLVVVIVFMEVVWWWCFLDGDYCEMVL